jgi:threonyl-tRNA synthetase
MKIVLPGGKIIEGKIGMRIIDLVKDRNILVAKVDGKLLDLSSVLEEDKEVILLNFDSKEGKETYWHTTSHILAQAVKELFKEAKLGIGPPIEKGFYYDFDLGGKTFLPEDLERIEERMREIIERDLPIRREEISRERAIELFEERKEPYKVELLEEIEDERVSVYWQGDFVDLCTGPHLPSTGYVKHFRLLSSSSAYWRGDEEGPVLQRVYGISFPEKELLDDYLEKIEEAKRRDHRKLGRELDLYSVSESIGPALILWHPKGARLRQIIERFLIEIHLSRGYEFVYTPHVGKSWLWETSGHLDFYKEMFPPMKIGEESYYVKPMNCPFHIEIYKSRVRSYRELPIRYAEFGTVYRYERPGVLHGLMRVRGFTQDDAHIFCTPEQVEDEIVGVIDLALEILGNFGFKEYEISLSTRPEEYVGEPENWELAEESLKRALERKGLSYEVKEGEGAFYGPKIDIDIRDALGRTWQCTTIQFDFNLPERFDVKYRDRDGVDRRPYMIHRALLGSFERFLGVLIEYYGGNFPLWLAPIQIAILPITNGEKNYAEEIAEKLKEEGFRVHLDDRNEKIGYKISEAERQKIPYMIIVGKREVERKTVSLRKHGKGDLGEMKIEEVISSLKEEIERKL